MPVMLLGAVDAIGFYALVQIFGFTDVVVTATIISAMMMAFISNHSAFKMGEALITS